MDCTASVDSNCPFHQKWIIVPATKMQIKPILPDAQVGVIDHRLKKWCMYFKTFT